MSDIGHIGIAVEDLEKASEIFSEIIGRKPSEVEEVANQKVKLAIFSSRDDPDSACIELLAPADEDSPIKAFLDKRGTGLHHISIRVDNIEQKLLELKAKGFRLIDESPRIGSGGRKIAFIHPASAAGVLVELQEK